MNKVVVFMGVSGCGKSTLLQEFKRNGYTTIEGDDFHPQSNVLKMANGVPLTDQDRHPWLQALADEAQKFISLSETQLVFMTCSCLKRSYRNFLRDQINNAQIIFILLEVPVDMLELRMKSRKHFMPPSLLQSQLADLEAPVTGELIMTVDGRKSIQDLYLQLLQAIS
jgi:gluconokinase